MGPKPRPAFGNIVNDPMYTTMVNNTGQPMIDYARNRQGPMIDQTLQNQFRDRQMSQLDQLGRIASGTQKGAGELAAERQVQNALAQQMAGARMARGSMAGLAGRTAARQGAAIGLSGVGMGQQAALQDQSMAQQLMGQLSTQGRGQDIGIAQGNAQLAQGQYDINDRLMLGLLGNNTEIIKAKLAAIAAENAAKLGQPGIGGYLLQAGGQIGAAAVGK